MRTACVGFALGAWWVQQRASLLDAQRLVVILAAAFAVALLLVSAAARHARAARPAVGRRRAHAGATPDPSEPPLPPQATSSIAWSTAWSTASPTASSTAGLATAPRRSDRWPDCATWIAIALLSVALGFAWATWRAQLRLAEALSPTLENQDIGMTGVVVTLPGPADRGVRFEFEVEALHAVASAGRPPTIGVDVPTHVGLAWYAARDAHDAASVPAIEPGQRWRFVVRLKRPHGSANPAGFDYEYWLLEEGLRATGYVRAQATAIDPTETSSDDDAAPVASDRAWRGPRLVDRFVVRFDTVVDRLRSLLRARILQAFAGDGPGGARYAGVLVALVVGDQRAIADADWVVFNRTGIGHLISISGLHVSMLASLGAWCAFAWWRRRPAWAGRVPAQKAAAVAGFAVALAYCLLAGFGVPAQRTLYMIGVVALALWTHRMTSPSRVLCVALAVVVALDPWSVMGAGFWLSFAAVASIFLASAGRLDALAPHATFVERRRHDLAVAGRIQWAVTLALTPLTLLFFSQVSLVSPLANAVAIPLVSFVVTPLALAGAVAPASLGFLLLHGAHALLVALAWWLSWLSGWSIAVWTGAAPTAWTFAAAMVGVGWWLSPRGLPHRWAGALWLVPLFAWPPDRPSAGAMRIVALDIGQGTSVLVQTHAHDVLYDTGPAFGPGHDAGNRVVVPYLRAQGIDRLDRMIVSHNDLDHSGGALSILAAMPVDETWSSLASTSPIVMTSRHAVRCTAGQSWSFDGVRFAMLHPLSIDDAAPVKPNAKSCVLRIEAHGRSILLTGDIERPQETALVERAAAALASDVLLVPHHGSRTSSSAGFLDAVRPSLAIVQAGYLNRFGHPRPDVLARYAERDVRILRNDRDGAVTIDVDETGLTVDRYRDSHRRYWYGR